MVKDVKVLKLINGEEIITRLEEGDNGLLILEEPRVVQAMPPNSAGRVGIGFVPWSVCAKLDKVILENKHVMVILEPKKDMETNYLSGITGLSL